jgi:serine/threonine protein kinase
MMLHRDVKPDNIFLSSTGFAQLGDLGVAREYDAEYMTRAVGTPHWIAPEVFGDGGFILACTKVDVRAHLANYGITPGQPVHRRLLRSMWAYYIRNRVITIKENSFS